MPVDREGSSIPPIARIDAVSLTRAADELSSSMNIRSSLTRRRQVSIHSHSSLTDVVDKPTGLEQPIGTSLLSLENHSEFSSGGAMNSDEEHGQLQGFHLADTNAESDPDEASTDNDGDDYEDKDHVFKLPDLDKSHISGASERTFGSVSNRRHRKNNLTMDDIPFNMHELEASGTPHSHGKLEHNSLAGFSLSRSDTRSFKLRDSQQSEDMAKLPDLDENFSIVGRQRRKNSNHSEPSRDEVGALDHLSNMSSLSRRRKRAPRAMGEFSLSRGGSRRSLLPAEEEEPPAAKPLSRRGSMASLWTNEIVPETPKEPGPPLPAVPRLRRRQSIRFHRPSLSRQGSVSSLADVHSMPRELKLVIQQQEVSRMLAKLRRIGYERLFIGKPELRSMTQALQEKTTIAPLSITENDNASNTLTQLYSLVAKESMQASQAASDEESKRLKIARTKWTKLIRATEFKLMTSMASSLTSRSKGIDLLLPQTANEFAVEPTQYRWFRLAWPTSSDNGRGPAASAIQLTLNCNGGRSKLLVTHESYGWPSEHDAIWKSDPKLNSSTIHLKISRTHRAWKRGGFYVIAVVGQTGSCFGTLTVTSLSSVFGDSACAPVSVKQKLANRIEGLRNDSERIFKLLQHVEQGRKELEKLKVQSLFVDLAKVNQTIVSLMSKTGQSAVEIRREYERCARANHWRILVFAINAMKRFFMALQHKRRQRRKMIAWPGVVDVATQQSFIVYDIMRSIGKHAHINLHALSEEGGSTHSIEAAEFFRREVDKASWFAPAFKFAGNGRPLPIYLHSKYGPSCTTKEFSETLRHQIPPINSFARSIRSRNTRRLRLKALGKPGESSGGAKTSRKSSHYRDGKAASSRGFFTERISRDTESERAASPHWLDALFNDDNEFFEGTIDFKDMIPERPRVCSVQERNRKLVHRQRRIQRRQKQEEIHKEMAKDRVLSRGSNAVAAKRAAKALHHKNLEMNLLKTRQALMVGQMRPVSPVQLPQTFYEFQSQ